MREESNKVGNGYALELNYCTWEMQQTPFATENFLD